MPQKPTYEELEARIRELEKENNRGLAAISALEESKRNYRLIAENINDVIWKMDLDTMGFNFVSPSILKLTGYTYEEYLRKTLEDILPPDESKPVIEILREAARPESSEAFHANGTRRFEWEIFHKDGHLIWVEVDTKLLKNNDGNFTSVIGVARDISYRKSREAHIEERNVFIETILAHLPIGLAVNKISDSKAIYMNEKFEEIYGWPKEHIIDIESFFTCAYPDEKYRNEIYNKIMTDIESGDPSRMSWENVHVTGINGEKKIVSAKNIPIPEQNLMISTVQDVTQKVQLEDQLRHTQKMKSIDTLTGGISHDFNNILSIMVGNTELALDEISESNPAYQYLLNIKNAGLRAADIIKQLLEFSKKTETRKKPINLVPLIEESLKLVRAVVPASVDIRTDLPEDCDPIMGNPSQIHQIMINLCSNASEAMDDGGILEINLENVHLDDRYVLVDKDLISGDYVKLSVRDTGRGIDPDDLCRIFDPYFTTKDVGKGSGMGLAVVHGIVKSWGGSIIVNSEPGQGSTITIYFPVTDMQMESDAPIENELPSGNKRILFVDDEPLIVELAQKMLEKMGYRVTTRLDPLDALDLFVENPHQFDLGILDITMPHMTGDNLAIEILKHNPDIPLILCTGHREKMYETHLLDIGIRDFLMKPLLKEDLANIVQRVLNRN